MDETATYRKANSANSKREADFLKGEPGGSSRVEPIYYWRLTSRGSYSYSYNFPGEAWEVNFSGGTRWEGLGPGHVGGPYLPAVADDVKLHVLPRRALGG